MSKPNIFTSEPSKMYMAMTVTESGPVSLNDPYSAFTLPLMGSGSIFGGYYGFVKGGIWQITEEFGQTYFDRNDADDPARSFYRFGSLDNAYLCGSGTYPCGSVTGTLGYMCSHQLLAQLSSGRNAVAT
ncbi:MAG: hypothetical protein V3R81_03265 [Gammaproteobacteria bacterium]